MAVTVVKVLRHGQPSNAIYDPDPGKRLYAVQFRFRDTGTAAYSDAPSNGTVVTDAAGRSYGVDPQRSRRECLVSRQREHRRGQHRPGVRGVGGAGDVEDHGGSVHAGFRDGPQMGQWEVRR